MGVADKLGLGPKRDLQVFHRGGHGILTITPPAWIGNHEPKQVFLTRQEVVAYRRWLEGEVDIQTALPSLLAVEREIILNGGVTCLND